MTGVWGSLDSFRIGAGCQKENKILLEVGTFSPISQPLEWEEVLELELNTNGQGFNQSCQHKETSIKARKQWGLVSFQVGEHIEVLAG